MTKKDFDKRQLKLQRELLKETPSTQIEKDIWNLKWIRYSIKHGSFAYQHGFIKTLDRAIGKLEAEAKPKAVSASLLATLPSTSKGDKNVD